ncbi:MAG TPA: TonB-dependent receptor [Thermoanaerobaculaceae bacterium]|nr:TonB-dependent receptor [Thermoanaerobaculaceae bacterium]
MNRFKLLTMNALTMILILAAVVMVRPVLAQSADGTDQRADLPRVPGTEIVVTAPRQDVPLKDNPAATTVVTEEMIKKGDSKTVAADEALKLVPGVKVDNQADGERVHLSIRGQGLLTERGVRGIKVLLDGIPLNDPTGFAPDMFDVDWATVQRVEVFRGPASALYGGGAAGGIINITTRDGEKDRDKVDASVTAGSYGFWKALAETAGSTGDMTYRVSASRSMGDGYRDHTAYSATNLYGKFRFDPSPKTRVTAIVAGTSFFNENAEGLNLTWLREDRRQANPDANTFNELQRTKRGTLGVSGQTALADNQDLSYSVFYRNWDWKEAVPSSVQHRNYENSGAFLQYTLQLGSPEFKHHLSLGADLEWQNIDDFRRPNMGRAIEGPTIVSDQSIEQSGRGFYLLDRIEMGSQWGAMVGVRSDTMNNKLTDDLKVGGVSLSGKRDFDKTTGRVGVTWNPTQIFGMYASWGQGFMPPATEELANNPAHLGGFNKDLEPATSKGEELGARGFVGDMVAYDVALFHLTTDNDFGRYRVTDRPLETFYRNAGASRRWGVETLLAWYPVKPVEVQLAYTYNNFKYTEIKSLVGNFEDRYMPNAPEHQAYLDVEYRASDRFVLGASGELVSRSYVDQSNQTWAGGYTLLHLRAAYQWSGPSHRGEVSIAVRNATDKEFIAFTEPDPDGNSYQPAATRELFGGIHIWLGK